MKNFKKIKVSILVLVLLSVAAFSFAQTPIVTLHNPLSVNSFYAFIKAILDAVVVISIPIITLAIIYSGFLFVKARGNEGELEKAKHTLLYTIIGAAIVLGSWILSKAICNTIIQLGVNGTCQ